MTVKNGMPFLPYALESVAVQSYRDFELVVQDGASTDGTLELFQRYADDARLKHQLRLVSEQDESLAEAKMRAMRRCRGAIIGSIDSDNMLEPDCLAAIAQFFQKNPSYAAIYGAQHMIDESNNVLSDFTPGPFILIDHLECSLVPPFGSSYFQRSLVGDRILPALDLLYCADFELWLNISDLPIQSTSMYLARTRISKSSITCRPQTYERSCLDKITAIRRFFERNPKSRIMDELRVRSEAGVYLWAAESIKFHFPSENSDLYFLHYLKKAVEILPDSKRAWQLMQRAGINL